MIKPKQTFVFTIVFTFVSYLRFYLRFNDKTKSNLCFYLRFNDKTKAHLRYLHSVFLPSFFEAVLEAVWQKTMFFFLPNHNYKTEGSVFFFDIFTAPFFLVRVLKISKIFLLHNMINLGQFSETKYLRD